MMINKNNLLFFILLSSFSNFVFAQNKIDSKQGFYKKEMLSLQTAIKKNFYDSASGYYRLKVSSEKQENPYTYLWSLYALVQAANELEKVEPKAKLLQSILTIIGDYRDPAPPEPDYADYITKPGFKGGERYYDDNQWIGITALDAFTRIKNQSYLNLGKEIYKFMMTGYETVLTGGLYWKENRKTSKNTCSNGPGIIVALQLYQATKDKKYLDTALLIYNWTNQKLRAPSGLYWDNISTGDGKISKATLSYNTGSMLQSNVYLYECTGDKKYLKEATAIADSSLPFFYGSNKFRDSYWFNACC